MIIIRTLRKDIANYNKEEYVLYVFLGLGSEREGDTDQEEPGLKV